MKTDKKKREIYPPNKFFYNPFSAIILILGVCLGVGLLVAASPCSRASLIPAISFPSPIFSPSPILTPIIPGWKLYTNRVVGYSIEVPLQWQVKVNEDTS